MDSNRIKEIQLTTAYPDSISVMLALNQVWNECSQQTQELQSKNKLLKDAYNDQVCTIEGLANERDLYSEQTQELQRQVEELTKERDVLNFDLGLTEIECNNTKTLLTSCETALNNSQSDYTKLKEAADEMFDELNGWNEHCDAIITYKHLTNKP